VRQYPRVLVQSAERLYA